MRNTGDRKGRPYSKKINLKSSTHFVDAELMIDVSDTFTEIIY